MNSNFYDILSNPDEDWKEQSPSKWSLVARWGMPEASPLKIDPPHRWLKDEASSIHAPVEVVSDPTIINPCATTCPRRTSVDVVKSSTMMRSMQGVVAVASRATTKPSSSKARSQRQIKTKSESQRLPSPRRDQREQRCSPIALTSTTPSHPSLGRLQKIPMQRHHQT
jgi:hypothetical protein